MDWSHRKVPRYVRHWTGVYLPVFGDTQSGQVGGEGGWAGADPGFSKGGGSRRGYRIFHQHPPLGHCPRDVIGPQKN